MVPTLPADLKNNPECDAPARKFEILMADDTIPKYSQMKEWSEMVSGGALEARLVTFRGRGAWDGSCINDLGGGERCGWCLVVLDGKGLVPPTPRKAWP